MNFVTTIINQPNSNHSVHNQNWEKCYDYNYKSIIYPQPTNKFI